MRPSRHPASKPLRTLPWIMLLVALSAISCGRADSGSLPDDTLVLVVSSDLAVGNQRVVVSALGPDNRSLVTDEPVGLTFLSPDGSPQEEVPARFVWAIPEIRGMWVADFRFDSPGRWTPAVRTPDGKLVTGAPFQVATETITPNVGEAGPASPSKTLDDGPIETLTTDPHPDLRLYEVSVAEAVASGRPSVIVFATPAFCISQTCGPVLDTAKALIDRYPEVNWIHVEVYDNLDAASPEELVPVPAALDWMLPSEPWVFVVDGSGVVTDRFEGLIDRTELENALLRIKR